MSHLRGLWNRDLFWSHTVHIGHAYDIIWWRLSSHDEYDQHAFAKRKRGVQPHRHNKAGKVTGKIQSTQRSRAVCCEVAVLSIRGLTYEIYKQSTLVVVEF